MTAQETEQSWDFDAFQRQVMDEFRANGGKVGGMFEGSTLVLLTTTGAKSGRRRTNPLGYMEIDGQSLVVASAMGAPTSPAWYHNIRRNPVVTVETGTETYEAVAQIPTGAERDALWAKVIEVDAGFADYQAKTTRVIPVVTLHRVVPPTWERGMGDFVVEVHDWLRQELAELRRRADAMVEGKAESLGRTPDLMQQLHEHCATFCGALTKHHTGEDMGTFPMLARRFPGLAPALETLGTDHEVVAQLQEQIKNLVDGYRPGTDDPVQLRADLERLASTLEDHFAYEERTIVTALNAVAPAPDFD